jgi:hypothetical protein
MASIVNRVGPSTAAAATTITVVLPVSAGTNRRARIVGASETTTETIDSATFDGNAATALAATLDFGGMRTRAFEYLIPDALPPGNYDCVVTKSGGTNSWAAKADQLADCHPSTASVLTSNTAGTGGATVAVSGSVNSGDALLTVHLNASGSTTATAASSEVTFGSFADVGGSFRTSSTDAIGDATETVTVTWTNSNTSTTKSAIFIVTPTGPVGPTITVQPANDVGIISNGQSTVYTGTATGTTISAFTWEVDGTPIADGGVYDIVTTGIGTGEASSTLTITRTDKTGTPFDINFDVTDANGTTASNTVTDTWWTGPALTTFPATDGDGESTATLTSDFITEDNPGTAIEVRIPLADGDVTVTVTTTAA